MYFTSPNIYSISFAVVSFNATLEDLMGFLGSDYSIGKKSTIFSKNRTKVVFFARINSNEERNLLGKIAGAMGLKNGDYAVVDDVTEEISADYAISLGTGFGEAPDTVPFLRTVSLADMLKNPETKKQAWADLKVVVDHLGLNRQ